MKEPFKSKEFTSLALRKYCDYQKFLLLKSVQENITKKVVKELAGEDLWKEVLTRMGVVILGNESAELEYKKAFYKHKFDRAWLTEILKIESDHYIVMGAILEFAKPKTCLPVEDPLTLSNNQTDYKFEVNE